MWPVHMLSQCKLVELGNNINVSFFFFYDLNNSAFKTVFLEHIFYSRTMDSEIFTTYKVLNFVFLFQTNIKCPERELQC